MKEFSGLEYLKIDIANNFGSVTGNTFEDMIAWTDSHSISDLEMLDDEAKHPILYRKAINALRVGKDGAPINHIMGLDATASGIQILSVVSGCEESAKHVNLVNTGRKQCVYTAVAEYMTKASEDREFTRNDVKKSVSK
jgi:DNA-directed RNA polymerase